MPIIKSKITFVFDIHENGSTINFIFDYLKSNVETSFSSIKLLYRSSLHGDNTKTLHELCDNKQNVLIVIKSDNGCLFGGFSKIGFKTSKSGEEKIDNHSFLFSITKQKIYHVINNKPIIYHYTNYYGGFCIFNSFAFYDNFIKRFGYISSSIKNYFNGLGDIYEMNNGKDKFIIEELEVYQLL